MPTRLPYFGLLVATFKNPCLIFVTIPPVVIATPQINFADACTILTALFIADAITGIWGSYFDWRQLPNREDRYFFGKSGQGFSSDKLKKMGIKFLVYAGTPLVFYFFQKVYHIRTFKIETLSNADFDTATALILGASLIELYSIFIENLPKCGFDLMRIFKRMKQSYNQAKQ